MRLPLDTLCEVFVRCADDHAFDTRITLNDYCCGCKSIVGLKVHHRRDNNASRGQHILQDWKLRRQIRFNSFAGLVARP
jgi:hypothetical protein